MIFGGILLKEGGKVTGQICRKFVVIGLNGNSEHNLWVLVESALLPGGAAESRKG